MIQLNRGTAPLEQPCGSFQNAEPSIKGCGALTNNRMATADGESFYFTCVECEQSHHREVILNHTHFRPLNPGQVHREPKDLVEICGKCHQDLPLMRSPHNYEHHSNSFIPFRTQY